MRRRPHVGFSRAMRRMSARTFGSSIGRPIGVESIDGTKAPLTEHPFSAVPPRVIATPALPGTADRCEPCLELRPLGFDLAGDVRAAVARDVLVLLHSTIRSAWSRTDGGIARPSAFAVLALTINSKFVGCSTG